MKLRMKNLTRRPVSVLCNSGRSYHLPPKYEYEISANEIEGNPYINKLLGRKVVEITRLSEPEKTEKETVAKKPKAARVDKAKKTTK